MLLLPLTGLSTAILLLGEEPTKHLWVGGAIILFGIGMILFSKPKKNDKMLGKINTSKCKRCNYWGRNSGMFGSLSFSKIWMERCSFT